MAEIKRSLAVVIGINHYINNIPTLKTAVNDARKLAQILEKNHQYHVLLLLDKDATYSKLCELFTAFEQQRLPFSDGVISVEPNDRILFYFAGHGIALDGLDNADGPAGFLVPQDACIDNCRPINVKLTPMKGLRPQGGVIASMAEIKPNLAVCNWY